MDSIGDFGNLVSVLALVITWMVLQPLKQALSALQKSVDGLIRAVNELRESNTVSRVAISEIDQRTRSLHKRVDELRDDLNGLRGK